MDHDQSATISRLTIEERVKLALERKHHRPLGGLNPHSPLFDSIGQQFRTLLIDHLGLTPHHSFLDLGCGMGRLTKAMQGWMGPNRYAGADLNRYFIDFCQGTYAGNFQHFDLWHPDYNNAGKLTAEMQLPYPDGSFQCIAAIAMLNHCSLAHFNWFCREAARLLRPRGVLFATAFVLNYGALDDMAAGKTAFTFHPLGDGSWCQDLARPCGAVAFEEELIRRAFIDHGLMLREPIRYGQWVGSPLALTGHDVLLAAKEQWH